MEAKSFKFVCEEGISAVRVHEIRSGIVHSISLGSVRVVCNSCKSLGLAEFINDHN